VFKTDLDEAASQTARGTHKQQNVARIGEVRGFETGGEGRRPSAKHGKEEKAEKKAISLRPWHGSSASETSSRGRFGRLVRRSAPERVSVAHYNRTIPRRSEDKSVVQGIGGRRSAKGSPNGTDQSATQGSRISGKNLHKNT